MSFPVISIGPELAVHDVAALLVRHRIGGVPVLAGGQLVGIVTESDLLRRHEIGTDHGADHRPWWRRLIGNDMLPQRYVKSHGGCAHYVMTRNVIAVSPRTPLQEIADIFGTKGIGRVPVLHENSLAGIVTCADLMKTIAKQGSAHLAPPARTDQDIRECLLAELGRQRWWHPGWSEVFVTEGVVEFRGLAETDAQKLAARVAAENVEGVVAVRDLRMLAVELSVMI